MLNYVAVFNWYCALNMSRCVESVTSLGWKTHAAMLAQSVFSGMLLTLVLETCSRIDMAYVWVYMCNLSGTSKVLQFVVNNVPTEIRSKYCHCHNSCGNL